MTNPIMQAALDYTAAGLLVLPCPAGQKHPGHVHGKSWKDFNGPLTDTELSTYFPGAERICIICGSKSMGVEVIDFDGGGKQFDAWCEAVGKINLPVERSPSGGYHVYYRCEVLEGGKPLSRAANKAVLIETRGEGQLIVCAPTPGYELLSGSLTDIPIITPDERDALLTAARSLNEYIPSTAYMPVYDHPPTAKGQRPGDVFNAQGDVIPYLEAHGWRRSRAVGHNQHFTRPGKSDGTSATLHMQSRVFYCFTANGSPFDAGGAYGPFQVFALLEHGGDYKAAAKALAVAGFGEQRTPVSVADEPETAPEKEHAPKANENPELLPDEIYRVPGLMGEIYDFSMSGATYPNIVQSFAGSLAMMSFLCGRKLKTPTGLHSNLYIIALASTGGGKEYPRSVNRQIATSARFSSSIVDNFASGEGIEDALLATPSILFQRDEAHHLVRGLTDKRDKQANAICDRLLSMYTSSASAFGQRKKADAMGEKAAINAWKECDIHNPNLVLYGTAIPELFYGSLSREVLINGLFGRFLILDSQGERVRQKTRMNPVPESIVQQATWWRKMCESCGPIEARTVEYTPKSEEMMDDFITFADRNWNESHAAKDAVGEAVWARAVEQAAKLALIYAASANDDYESMVMCSDAVTWAITMTKYQCQRKLHLAALHVADGEDDKNCLKIVRLLTERGGTVTRKDLMHYSHLAPVRVFNEVIDTLKERGTIIETNVKTGQRPATAYKLI